MYLLRWIAALLAAVVVSAGLGSIIQTQFNLARIEALNESIEPGARLEATAFDLISFAPLYAVILALALLIAMLVATWLVRFLPRARTVAHALLFALAGFAAVACALVAMNLMMPVTIIAATRTTSGLILLSLAGAVGGWVYFRLWLARPLNNGFASGKKA